MAHIEKRSQAVELRTKGYSYTIIGEKLGVSKGTLSMWLRDISYTPNAEVVARIGYARARSGEEKSRLKQESILNAAIQAKKNIGVLSDRDILLLGLGLYIGEGSKTHGIVRVVNANPAVIRLAIRWFKRSFGMTNKNFSIRIHLYPDSDPREAEKIWARETGLPAANFQKVQVDRRFGKKIAKRGKLPIGTAHLNVRGLGKKEWGVYLSRYIAALMNEVTT